MQLTEKQIKEFQDIFEREYGRKLSWKEASESAYNLACFAEVMYDCAVEQFKKDEKLKKYPKGFHLEEGTYNCMICYKQITGKESWYDKHGPKCLLCQKALDKGIVPASVCDNKDSWYAMWELDNQLGIKHQTARKMIRTGELKPRIITTEDGKPYYYVFIIKENNKILKPKSKPNIKIINEKEIEVDLKKV